MKDVKFYEKKVSDIKDVRNLQGSNGNWDVDQYMLGLYNGLEMALCILEEREPLFKSQSDFAKRQEEKALRREEHMGAEFELFQSHNDTVKQQTSARGDL